MPEPVKHTSNQKIVRRRHHATFPSSDGENIAD